LPRLYILFPRVNILGWFCSPSWNSNTYKLTILLARSRARAYCVRVYVRDRDVKRVGSGGDGGGGGLHDASRGGEAWRGCLRVHVNARV